MTKTFDELEFTDDYMFCKVLTENPDICVELVELILGRQVERIEGLDEQKGVKLTPDGKGVRFDVYFSDQTNTVYDFEMQVQVPSEIPKRSRYYQGMLDLNILKSGKYYTELKNCYVVFISPNDPIHCGRSVYTFENLCVEDPTIHLNDGATKVFLYAGGDMEGVSPRLQEFLNFVAGKASNDTFVKRIQDAVEKVRNHDEWRAEYMTLNMKILEERQEGYKEGHLDGFQEGHNQLILRMLKNGISPEDISKNCDLPLNEVLSVQDNESLSV